MRFAFPPYGLRDYPAAISPGVVFQKYLKKISEVYVAAGFSLRSHFSHLFRKLKLAATF